MDSLGLKPESIKQKAIKALVMRLSVRFGPTVQLRSFSFQFTVDNFSFLLFWFGLVVQQLRRKLIVTTLYVPKPIQTWMALVQLTFPWNVSIWNTVEAVCKNDKSRSSPALDQFKWTWVWKQCILIEWGIMKVTAKVTDSLVASQLLQWQRHLSGFQLQSPSTSLEILPADGWFTIPQKCVIVLKTIGSSP